MKPYLSLFRVRFLNGLQYRAAAFGGLTTQFFWGVMLVFIYEAFYSSGASGDFTYRDMVTYIWLQQSFFSLFFLYEWDSELLEMIMTGGISYELCRPVNLYQVWYVKLLSKRLARAAMRFAPILIFAFALPSPYNLSPPQSALSLALFVIALFLGLFLVVSISMLIYISIFKTMSPVGSIGIFGIIGEFFAGMTIPIPLMPQWLQGVCMLLPFRWTADFPLRIYSGHIGAAEMLEGIAVQLVWIVALVTVGAFIMKRITRLSAVQGG